MCTGVWLNCGKAYFGRTLDYDISYGEEVVITSRNFPFKFRGAGECKSHFAMVGTACVKDGYPLYYDGMNEKGLCIAGLNFVGNARYCKREDRTPVEQFELIPYLLCKCSSVDGVLYEFSKICIGGGAFNGDMPAAQLHWLIADGERCIVVESVEEGLKIYENPIGVLTNNPPFDMQAFNLNNYRGLSARDKDSTFGGGLDLKVYSRGMGAIGLPGDWSSQSRFVRAAFARANSLFGDSEEEGVSQLFHILDTVAVPAGCCRSGEGLDKTVYSCCCSPQTGTYYFKTYNDLGISAVRLNKADLNCTQLIRFPHGTVKGVNFLN